MGPLVMLRRRPDWEKRLTAVVAAASARAFVWGDQDCALFALDCLDAMTGAALAAGYRGRYSTMLEAADIIGPGGLADLAGRVARDNGLIEIPAADRWASRGAVCLFQGERDLSLGILIDTHVAAPGPVGLIRTPRAAILRAWEIADRGGAA